MIHNLRSSFEEKLHFLTKYFPNVAALLLLGIWATSNSIPAYAHAFAPALLRVEEYSDPGTVEPFSTEDKTYFKITWKTPLKQVSGNRLTPHLPSHCKSIDTTTSATQGPSHRQSWHVNCGSIGIMNQQIGADNIASSGTNVIVRLRLLDGRQYQEVLNANNNRFRIPKKTKPFTALQSYAYLGIKHLWFGLDHLLFVLTLVILIGFKTKLIWTMTGFTMGHSITLSLGALQLISFPQFLAEMLIAFSLIVVAAQITKQASKISIDNQAGGLLSRHPIALTFTLGLVHGLGFAGALTQIGLPQEAIPQALFGFNVGIEIAQLIGILVLWLAYLGAQQSPVFGRLSVHHKITIWQGFRWKLPVAIPIGTLAAFWFWQRMGGI